MSKRLIKESYYIIMHEMNELPRGYCNGHSQRSNAPMHRTTSIDKADCYDLTNAILISTEYRELGWQCEVCPEVSPVDELKILSYR